MTEEEARPKIKLKLLTGKLTKATKIGGKKKVLKQSGEVIILDDSPVKTVKREDVVVSNAAPATVDQQKQPEDNVAAAVDEGWVANLLNLYSGANLLKETAVDAPPTATPAPILCTQQPPQPIRNEVLKALDDLEF